jgi:ELWxxDGT repeat protein
LDVKGKSTSALFLSFVLGAVVAAALLPAFTPIDQPALALEGDPSAPAEAGAALRSDVREALLGLGITTFGTATPVAIGNLLFFTADDCPGVDCHGVELWRSDGTQAGTVMVKDINTGGDSNPQSLVNLNGVLFFSASGVVNGVATGRELWKSDGTEIGTVQVRDISPGGGNSNPTELTAVSGTLYFAADDGTHGVELWKSRGTATTTVLVSDIDPGGSSNPDHLTAVNTTLYFVARNGPNGRELWKSTGTRTRTILVKDIAPGGVSSDPDHLTSVNGILYFSADDGPSGQELWKTNGTNSGTIRVKDINGGGISSPADLTPVGRRLFFSANDGGVRRLWSTDGTNLGTVLITDSTNPLGPSNPHNLINLGGVLIFSADDGLGLTGEELWRSNGTAAGTRLLQDIRPGPLGSSLQRFTVVDTSLFLVADDGANGTELWVTNGEDGGTLLVKDINLTPPAPASSDPDRLTSVNGLLFFTANDGVNGIQLWTSDGTFSGTDPVSASDAVAGSSNPSNFINHQGSLFISANNGSQGRELWKSGGSPATTKLVSDIFKLGPSSNPTSLVSVGGTVFFSASNLHNGRELWKTDGTNGGTVLVKDISPGSSDSSPSELTAVGTTVFFAATDGPPGDIELWKTDGTALGTVRVRDITLGDNGSTPRLLTAFNGSLFFAADDGLNGRVLWRSDGTEAGTDTVKDPDDSVISLPSELTVVPTAAGSQLFFVAEDALRGRELWKLNGTRADVVEDILGGIGAGSRPQNLTAGKFNDNGVVRDVLYFTATDGADCLPTTPPTCHGFELWRSDGTPEGTSLVRDINTGRDDAVCGGECSSTPQSLVNVNGTLFFTAESPVEGRGLWKSDGTANGTDPIRLRDFVTLVEGSSPNNLTAFGSILLFTANSVPNGVELWRTDGTTRTRMIKDILPGPLGSSPENLLVAGNGVYFSADDGATGRELWRTDGTFLRTRLMRDIRP